MKEGKAQMGWARKLVAEHAHPLVDSLITFPWPTRSKHWHWLTSILRTQSSRVGKVLRISWPSVCLPQNHLSDFAVPKHQHALRELSDIVLMRHKNNRQSLSFSFCRIYDLYRGAAVEASGGSSASKSTAGSPAPAIATRCCWPPDICEGK
jgi:hypothetical protein